MSHPIHTYTELQQQIHDDLRIQHPEWVAKWRIPHVRFVRDVSDENARHFDAKGIQPTDRSYRALEPAVTGG
jgi:hypothetical protein